MVVRTVGRLSQPEQWPIPSYPDPLPDPSRKLYRVYNTLSSGERKIFMPVAPTLNILCNIWKQVLITVPPPAGPPTYVNVPCNLQFGRKVHVGLGVYPNPNGTMWLDLPAGTDVQDWDQNTPFVIDYIECPAGSGRKYAVLFADDMARGFPTQTRIALICKVRAISGAVVQWLWTTPYP